MVVKPYVEKIISEAVRIRKFSASTPKDHLVWHRDRQNRVVEVIGGKGWMFQRDGSIPVLINPGTIFEVRSNEWHRIIKGDGDLIVKITEEKKKLSPKQKKIARAAPPPDEITGADFKALQRSKKDENIEESDQEHPKQYDAPQGSQRDEELDQTKRDLKRAEELRKKGKTKQAKELEQRAYDRRERMEKRDGKNESFERILVREIIEEIISEIELDIVLNELDQRLDEKLSAKTKATLKKKAEKRGLTPSSVYAEFRKGLAAWATSGSRKGMSQHQWAHARVNSATPSKSWAVVKKAKKKKKGKKGKKK